MFANPSVSKAHNFFSREDNLLNFVVLYTLECWLQDQVDRSSFHNVSNVAPNVNLPLAWPSYYNFPLYEHPYSLSQVKGHVPCTARIASVHVPPYLLPRLCRVLVWWDRWETRRIDPMNSYARLVCIRGIKTPVIGLSR